MFGGILSRPDRRVVVEALAIAIIRQSLLVFSIDLELFIRIRWKYLLWVWAVPEFRTELQLGLRLAERALDKFHREYLT